jgi:hypothetical protein
MMEAAGYLTATAYLMTGQHWPLAIVASLVALQLLQFPTRASAAGWVKQQLELLELEKPGNRTIGPA